MKTYSNYIPTDVFWQPHMPSHWRVVKLRHVLTKLQRKRIQGAELLICSNKGTVHKRGDSKLGLVAEDEQVYQGVANGDLLIHGMDTWHGAIALSGYDGMCTPVVHVCDSSQNKAFIGYYLRNMAVGKVFKLISNGVRQNTSDFRSWDKLASIPVVLPPLSEQQAIVSYLDDKCVKLDQLVTNKEKEIELLQEMKQRVISDAVTRGLNPDVKFKNTGISWLPQIPEHWEFIKLKAFCKDNKEKNRDNVETQVLSLSYGKVIVKQNINFGLVPDSYETYQIVNPGYIILRLTDLQNDHKSLRTGLVKDRGIITSAYVGLIVKGMVSEYAQLMLHSYDIMKVFYGMGGGLRQSMGYQDISNLYIPVPPIDEQKAIVAYIEERVAKIDALSQKLQQEIENIKEYKQRLISDVVTGQIKVC